jgi:hypothetical protein
MSKQTHEYQWHEYTWAYDNPTPESVIQKKAKEGWRVNSITQPSEVQQFMGILFEREVD